MTDEDLKESLKRSIGDVDGPAHKRAHIADSDDSVQVKILIPSSAVGAIIGKGGETMRNLKNDSKCRVQMSKNQEVYPGTNERICMVKGKVTSVMMVMECVMDKIKEKVDGSSRDPFDHKDVPRNREMKLLMPNTSAGMVIGKAGASIKEIRESSGCQIQVFPKAGSPEAKNSLERVVTIAHDDNSKLMEAIQRVLEKVSADPMHAQPVDHKDHDNFGQVAMPERNVFGGGPQQGGGGSGGQFSFQQNNPPSSFGGGSGAFGGSQSKFNGSGFQFNPMQGLGNNELMSFLDNLQSTLRTSGFNEAAVAEVMQAMQVLAKYNIMGLGLGLGVAAMAQMRSADGNQSSGFGGQQQSGGFGGAGMDSSFSSQDNSNRPGGQCWGYSASQMGQQAQQPPQQHPSRLPDSGIEAGGFATTVIVERPSEDETHIDLEVPDSIVGAVLGPKAQTLIEIQKHSGCKVVVHKRSEQSDLPEGSRLISLTGEPESMASARTLIERVINGQQQRRQAAGATRGSS